MTSVSRISRSLTVAAVLTSLSAPACSFDNNPVKKSASSKDAGAAKDGGHQDGSNEEPPLGDSSVDQDGGQL